MDNNDVQTLEDDPLPCDWPDVRKREPGAYDQPEVTTRFRHGVNDFHAPRLVVKELAMLNLMNAITDKPGWEDKVYMEDIVAKWKIEALQHKLMSDIAFDWCMGEIQGKVKGYRDNKYITVLDNASVCVKSDVLVSADLQDRLKEAVDALKQTLDVDWHPNSHEQVLNLVHPSLFPLVFGKSRGFKSRVVGIKNAIALTGKGDVIPVHQGIRPDYTMQDEWRTEPSNFWSERFQWLPSEVRFADTSEAGVEITSYINNLHPVAHENLYGVIEHFISISVKAWNEVLIRGDQGRLPPRIKTLGVDILNGRVPAWAEPWEWVEEGVSASALRLAHDYLALPDRPGLDNGDVEDEVISLDNLREMGPTDLYELLHAKTMRRRTWNHPEPGQAYSYDEWKAGKVDKLVFPEGSTVPSTHDYYSIDLEKEFRTQGLQVIVKLASIELSPTNPSYAGGSWHLEGMLNEHIVATSIYYYDVSNTTESRVSFRQEAVIDEEELEYEQNDHEPLADIFGCDDMYDEPAVQEIGSISTPAGRFLAFPNTLQHRVEPFRLADGSQPGHRRFLVLWLVDPHLRIISTANVPPQQHGWWAAEATRAAALPLPPEMTAMIMAKTDEWPMGMEEARALRLELMAERTSFADTVEAGFGVYNLCEH